MKNLYISNHRHDKQTFEHLAHWSKTAIHFCDDDKWKKRKNKKWYENFLQWWICMMPKKSLLKLRVNSIGISMKLCVDLFLVTAFFKCAFFFSLFLSLFLFSLTKLTIKQTNNTKKKLHGKLAQRIYLVVFEQFIRLVIIIYSWWKHFTNSPFSLTAFHF